MLGVAVHEIGDSKLAHVVVLEEFSNREREYIQRPIRPGPWAPLRHVRVSTRFLKVKHGKRRIENVFEGESGVCGCP